MPRRNIHCLAKDERQYFNEKYDFSIVKNDDDTEDVVVKIIDYNRMNRHSIDTKFSLLTCIRRLTITVEAMHMWRDHFYGKTKEFTLIDIQDAMNRLTVSYQELTYENVLDVLKSSKRN